jgi:hypothetical protein
MARNLVYWFLGISYFVCTGATDGDCGCSFFLIGGFLSVNGFLSALMHTVVILYHGYDYCCL